MEISIFRKVTLPKNKKEKDAMVYYASEPYLPEVYPSSNLETLVDAITNVGWSPFIFNGYKLQENFVKCDFAVLDIDDNITIQQAKKRLEELDYFAICLPSPRHKPEHHKFRIVIPFSQSIKNKMVYKDTMTKLVRVFPEADPACITDTARFYFPCRMSDDGFITQGEKFIDPEPERKKVPIVRNYDGDRKKICELLTWYIENVQQDEYSESGVHVQCPACRLEGKDSSMDNLYITDEEMFYHCFANPEHNDIMYKSLVKVKESFNV